MASPIYFSYSTQTPIKYKQNATFKKLYLYPLQPFKWIGFNDITTYLTRYTSSSYVFNTGHRLLIYLQTKVMHCQASLIESMYFPFYIKKKTKSSVTVEIVVIVYLSLYHLHFFIFSQNYFRFEHAELYPVNVF